MTKSRQLVGAESIVDKFLSSHIRQGRLTIVYPSGQQRSYGDKSKAVKVTIKRLPLLGLRNPTMFLGESYMFGNLQVAEEQLDDLFRLMSDNESDSFATHLIQKLPKRQANRRKRQRQQISHHYDIGNDYYKLWLDKTMTYSCAYFKKITDSLETAQNQKIHYVLQKLQLKAGQKLLDIGCGWGYLAVAAAKQYGVEVVGITLSHEQLASANKLAQKSGVGHLVTFKLANYQDLSGEQQFDRIVSVGMFEHVGQQNHASYFQKIRQLLKDEGISVLHTITARNEQATSPWIDKYIFPGGYLPTVDMIEKLLSDYKFFSIDRENLWQHYAMTLDIWRARHRAHRSQIIEMFDENFYRMQDFWLAGSAAAFRYSGTSINQFIFTKHKPSFKTWPLTRKYLTH
ncbi:cyclopropane-fatty-acyl-phospholipid synthase family protein [Candidatus Parcubacteria bacterium]|nr:cyclopropane-fatty-acyl-phospholipid synthase family protein [Candidatus Parcubacteria bacterium]